MYRALGFDLVSYFFCFGKIIIGGERVVKYIIIGGRRVIKREV